MVIFHTYVSHYQRVYSIKSHKTTIKPPFNHHFPMVFPWFSYGFGSIQPPESPWIPGSSKVLVYDMGGGTFDVSLLEIEVGQEISQR